MVCNLSTNYSALMWRSDFLPDDILAKARDLNAFQRPSNRDYHSFRTWFWNVKPLNYEPEEDFIKRREDLVSLRHGREWSGFDGMIETCIRKVHSPLTQVKLALYDNFACYD